MYLKNKKITIDFTVLITYVVMLVFLVQLVYKYAFYSAIQATWVLKLFSPSEIYISNISVLFMYITAGIFILYFKNDDEINILDIFSKLAIYTAPFVAIQLIFWPFSWGYLASLAILVVLIARGIYLLTIKKVNLLSMELGVVLFFFITVPPFFIAIGDSSQKRLAEMPVVHLKNFNTKNDFRLMDKAGDNFITININESNKPIIKLIKLDEVDYISHD